MTSIIIVPKIEQYSQRAAIEFYQYLEDKDCYAETIGYKSYANLFYSNKKEPLNKNSFDMDWLLRGPIDKPTYFVCKNIDSDEIEKRYEELKEIYRKNGFVFLQRMPK